MILGAMIVAGALALAPAAMAENSSVGTYAGQGGDLAGLVSGGDPSGTAAADSSGSLPFTGLDVKLLAGGGLLLLLAGVGMARVVARREDAV
jgi:hypothetical protein